MGRGVLLALVWFLLVGYSWTGTQIRQYDDQDVTGGHTAGQPHSALEMSASTDPNVAANWTAYVGNAAKYRGLATVLMGSSTGGTATTTWTDTNAVFDFDSGKGVSFTGVNCILNWGVKLGSGATASGRNGVTCFLSTNSTFGQRNNLYDCKIIVSGANNFLALAGDAASEYAGCTFSNVSVGSGANFRLGTAGTPTGSFYNCNFWANTTAATGSVFSTFNPTAFSGGYAGLNAAASFLRLTNSLGFTAKDLVMNGTPATADLIFVTSFGTGALVRPRWSGATKVSTVLTIPAGNLVEQRLFDVKVVNGSGAPQSGISVVLTDVLGNVPVNTTTNSEGRIVFGSGLQANAVTVLDHLTTAGVYSTRTRSPFILTVNGDRRIQFTWIGETSGVYEDVEMPVPLQYASGLSTTWTEMSL